MDDRFAIRLVSEPWRKTLTLFPACLKARSHIGASGTARLTINTSLVGATCGAILRSLGPSAWCGQILKRLPRLRNVHRPRAARARRVHSFRSGNIHLLFCPAWRFIFWRKPGFWLFPFGYFLVGYFLFRFGALFRNHDAVVVAQGCCGFEQPSQVSPTPPTEQSPSSSRVRASLSWDLVPPWGWLPFDKKVCSKAFRSVTSFRDTARIL